MSFFGDVGGNLLDVGGNLLDAGKNLMSYTQLGLVMDKYQQDRSQENMYEMSDKELANAKELQALQNKENALVRDENKQTAIDMYNLQTKQEYEMWEKEKAYNLDMWNRANEYNSPKAQMTRMSEAGLNPALMYQQGTTGNTTVIRAPELNNPKLETAEREPARYGHAGASPVPYRGSSLFDYVGMRNDMLSAKNLMKQNEILSKQKDLMDVNVKDAEYELGYKKEHGISKYDAQNVKTSKFFWDVFGPQAKIDRIMWLGMNVINDMKNARHGESKNPLDLQYDYEWYKKQMRDKGGDEE